MATPKVPPIESDDPARAAPSSNGRPDAGAARALELAGQVEALLRAEPGGSTALLLARALALGLLDQLVELLAGSASQLPKQAPRRASDDPER